MRNLKRALSLTLASVMLLGMMVVGAGAAGFPDVDEDTHDIEAIEVLQAVEVMIGDDNGNFGPDDLVNRSQMAVVMAKLLNLDYQYYEATCPFWDVPTWARGYVGACYAKGIVSGYGDGTYGAADGVTAVQAASMMMRALGYFQYAEDYKGGFELTTVSKGTDIGIFDGVGSSATASLTRNQVAKMALNALESEMVNFTGVPGTTYTTSTGEQLSVGYRAEYTPRTSTELKYKAIEDRSSDVSGDSNHRGQYYIQLGEELYNGKLTKKYARDDFERPSINWQFDGKEIGTYVDYDLLIAGGTFYDVVKGSEMYDLITYTTIRDNDLLSYTDGVVDNIKKEDLVRSNKNGVGHTGKGVLTEVFFDQDRDEVIITSINTYLAQANSNYNTTNESLSLKVFTDSDGKRVSSTTQVVDSADVPEAEGVAKDDFALVYMSGKEKANSIGDYVNYAVVDMFDAEIIADAAVTKFSTDGTDPHSKVVSKLTTDGTEYGTNVMAFYDYGNALETYNEQLLTDMTYNIFLDRYGNVIGVELEEGVKNYVFITGYDRIDSHISIKTAQAAAIFLDGTMDEITVNVTDTNKNIDKVKATNANYENWGAINTGLGANGVRDLNRWYTYTVSNNGNYTLKPVENFMYSSVKDSRDDTKPAAGKDLGVIVSGSDTTITLDSAKLYLDDSRPSSKDDRYWTAGDPTYTNKGRAYGNDDTVYITVEAGPVDYSHVSDITNDAIIDVKGVYTGIQNVKLELNEDYKQLVNDRKDPDDPLHKQNDPVNRSESNAYVYSVYDNNYYIIASVVLGEAQGAAANYAYIVDGVKSERIEYNSSSRSGSDVTYYWEFDAFYNGELTTLTAKTNYPGSTVLNKWHVQELRFDGDYVTSVKDVPNNKVLSENNLIKNTVEAWAKVGGHSVYDVGHVDTDQAIADRLDSAKQTHQTHTTKNDAHSDLNKEYRTSYNRLNGKIELVGRTLYVERDKTYQGVEYDNWDLGLALRSTSTPTLLIQPENGKIEKTVCSSVSEAIGRLADADNIGTNGKQFVGRVVAGLKDDAAEWVVIISDTNLTTGKDPNYSSSMYYLDLYNDLSNDNIENLTTVIASNSKKDDRVIQGYIYRYGDYGNGVCTRYEIPAGYNTVVIQDQDINTNYIVNNGIRYFYTSNDSFVNGWFANAQNHTLTIPALSGNVSISGVGKELTGRVSITVGANVNVTDASGNTVVTGTTGLKVGNTLTIVPVGNATLTTLTGVKHISGDVYEITSIVVNIAAANNGGDAGQASIALSDGVSTDAKFIVLDDKGNAIKTAKVGDKIALDPDRALEIKTGNGAADTGDKDAAGRTIWEITDKNVTVSPKTGFSWNQNIFGTWTGVAQLSDGTWSMDPAYPTSNADMSYTGAWGRMALARAAGDPVDPDSQWYGKVLAGTLVVDIKVPVNGREVVWTSQVKEGHVIFVCTSVDAAHPEDIVASIEQLDNSETKLVESGKAPVVPDASAACYAKIEGKTITMYKYGKAAPSDPEIVNAIIAALPSLKLTAEDIDITNPAAVKIKNATDWTLNTTIEKLYKVTMPDSSVKYLYSGEQVAVASKWVMDDDVAQTVTTPTSNYAGGVFEANADGKITFYPDTASKSNTGTAGQIDKAEFWDYTLVKALKVKGHVDAEASVTYALWIENSKDTANEGFTKLSSAVVGNGGSAKDYYVPAGKTLRIVNTDPTQVDKAVSFLINKNQYVTGTHGGNGVANIPVTSITSWKDNEEDQVTIAKASAGYTVKWGSRTIENPATPDHTWSLNENIDLGQAVNQNEVWIAGDWNAAAVEYVVGSGNSKVKLTSAIIGKADDKNVIQFNKAYLVATGEAYAIVDPKAAESGLTITDKMFVKDGYALEVVTGNGTNKGTLKPKTGSSWTLDTPSFPTTGDNSGKTVYEVVVDKNIGANEFVTKVAVANAQLTTKDLVGKAAGGKVTLGQNGKFAAFSIEVGGAVGASGEDDIIIDWDLAANGVTKLTKLSGTYTVTKRATADGNDTLNVTLVNKGSGTLELNVGDTGTLTINVNGLVVEVDVVVKAEPVNLTMDLGEDRIVWNEDAWSAGELESTEGGWKFTLKNSGSYSSTDKDVKVILTLDDESTVNVITKMEHGSNERQYDQIVVEIEASQVETDHTIKSISIENR